MNRPEYWESDEKWAEYEAWLAANPPPPEKPLTGLALAVAKARGDILSAKDMEERIAAHNELWRLVREAWKKQTDPPCAETDLSPSGGDCKPV